MSKKLQIGNITIGGNFPLVLIAGPCVIESEKVCREIAEDLVRITKELDIPFIFKASFDKANRSSIKSFRGVGMEKGLAILERIKKEFSVSVTSDIHCREQIESASKILDIIQIPALLSRQTDLIIEAASFNKPINIKKGQFLAPWDMEYCIQKVLSTGNHNIMLTERGTCFGYNNLITDMRALIIMARFGFPVIFDATHSVQLPGAKGGISGGQREFVSGLCRAAVAVGCDGLFIEIHKNPDSALSDGSNMIDFNQLKEIISIVKQIDGLVKNTHRIRGQKTEDREQKNLTSAF